MRVSSFLRVPLMFVLPTYLTLVAITTDQTEDDLSWLMFWVIMSIFYIMEPLLDHLRFLPFYPEIKLLFVAWCLLPGHLSGSEILFKLVSKIFIQDGAPRHFQLIQLVNFLFSRYFIIFKFFKTTSSWSTVKLIR